MQPLSCAKKEKNTPNKPPNFHALVALRQSLVIGPGPGPGVDGSAVGPGRDLFGRLGGPIPPRDELVVTVASVSGGEIVALGCGERKCRGGRKGQDGDGLEDGGKMHFFFFGSPQWDGRW